MIQLNKTYHGDCLDLMPNIADQSIDMVLVDLPYGTSRNKWDTAIPFGALWEQYKRIIKPSGTIVLTATQPFTSIAVMSNLKWFRHEWIWEKDNGSNFINAKRMPLKVHESVLVFSENTPRYFPQKTVGKPYSCRASENPYASNSRNQKRLPFSNSGTRYPRSIQKINTERGLHPTQKPVALFEYLIKTYTQEGDVVLDNCAGSGTTAIAAMNTGRMYICMEKDEEYYAVMKKRIRKRYAL